jgi:hypothetical protein
MRPERTYRCRVRPCQKVKGEANHWFVATIDADNRLIFEKFDKPERFQKAAQRHGAIEICSEKCCSVHLSRWMQGRINASNVPACGSPVFRTDTTMTAWVSSVYKTNTLPVVGKIYSSDAQPPREKNPARIVNYRDSGREQHMWCFNQDAFDRVEAAVGAHVKFRIQQRRDYTVIVDVIEVLDGTAEFKRRERCQHSSSHQLTLRP